MRARWNTCMRCCRPDITLRKVILAEWQREFEHPMQHSGLPRDFWLRNKDEISRRAEDIPLRNRLGFANCGAAWRFITDRLNKTDDLTDRIESALLGLRRQPLRAAATRRLRRLPSADDQVSARSEANAEAFASDFVDNILLPPVANADDPGRAREDFTIQVTDMEGGGAVNDDADVLRRIAGLGVLLRESGTTKWNCLSLAKLEVDGVLLDDIPRPASLRLGYRNGMRDSFVSYRNHPMAAKSPAADFAHHNNFGDPHESRALVQYANPYATNGPKLTPLVYNRKYDAAVFAIGNGGNLPKILTSQVSGKTIPSTFRLPTEDPPFFQTQLRYRRRVPVGLPRAEGQGGRKPGDETSRLDIPPIPDGVLPLTRSLFKPDPQRQHEQAEDTLVLLTPADRRKWRGAPTFAFGVRPPSVPLRSGTGG
jgi:hypothetical protein